MISGWVLSVIGYIGTVVSAGSLGVSSYGVAKKNRRYNKCVSYQGGVSVLLTTIVQNM